MTFAATGPTDLFISALFNQPQYNEHVKDWRWDLRSDKGNLHVIDYYLHGATAEPDYHEHSPRLAGDHSGR